MSDTSIAAAYARAMVRCGQQITIQRLSGTSPRTSLVSATVQAIVRDDNPDSSAVGKTGYGAGEVGSYSQDQRTVIVLAQDLAAQRFPLPVQKNDIIYVAGLAPLGQDSAKLNVVRVDSPKRQLGGAIEMTATGTK